MAGFSAFGRMSQIASDMRCERCGATRTMDWTESTPQLPPTQRSAGAQGPILPWFANFSATAKYRSLEPIVVVLGHTLARERVMISCPCTWGARCRGMGCCRRSMVSGRRQQSRRSSDNCNSGCACGLVDGSFRLDRSADQTKLRPIEDYSRDQTTSRARGRQRRGQCARYFHGGASA